MTPPNTLPTATKPRLTPAQDAAAITNQANQPVILSKAKNLTLRGKTLPFTQAAKSEFRNFCESPRPLLLQPRKT